MLLGIVLHGLLSFITIPIWPVQDNDQSEIYMIPLMFIHGFRMSLFFFVSGLFTRMIWQKKGTLGLLQNRAKRIVLPFLIFGALLFPVLNNMGTFLITGKNHNETEKTIIINPEYQVPNDLGGASRNGNLKEITEWLQKDEDINGKYDKGLTPLHWAAVMNQVDAIKLLADKGANLNSRDGHQSTPLFVAAFFGQTECILEK